MSSTFPTICTPPTSPSSSESGSSPLFRLSASSLSMQATLHRLSHDMCPTLPHVQHDPWYPQPFCSCEYPPVDPPCLPEPLFPLPPVAIPSQLLLPSSFVLPLRFLPQFHVMCPTIPQLYHTDPLRTSSTSSQSSSSGSLPRTWSTSIGTHISLCPPRVCSVLLVVYDTTFALKFMMSKWRVVQMWSSLSGN